MTHLESSSRQPPVALPPVLLHGWGFTPRVWQPLMNVLDDAFPVLTPALPFTGHLAEDLDQLATTLPPRVHLAGWSLGGEIALAYARRYPDRVASLTLIASTPCFLQQTDWTTGQPASLLDDFSQRLVDNPAALLKRFAMLIRHGDPEAAKNRGMADTLQAAAETDTTRLKYGLALLGSIDLREVMSEAFAVPLQLIHGEADAVIPIGAAIALHTSLASTRPSTRLHILTGASHAIPLSHAPTLAQHLQTFWQAWS